MPHDDNTQNMRLKFEDYWDYEAYKWVSKLHRGYFKDDILALKRIKDMPDSVMYCSDGSRIHVVDDTFEDDHCGVRETTIEEFHPTFAELHRDLYLGDDYSREDCYGDYFVIQYSVIYFNHYDQLDYGSIFTKIWDNDLDDFVTDKV